MGDRYRRLGRIHSLSKTGHIVVKLEDKGVRPGVKVLWRGERIGVVMDLIGNVNAPYAVVKLDERERISQLSEGDELGYIREPPRRGMGKRRKMRGGPGKRMHGKTSPHRQRRGMRGFGGGSKR